jgi:hypothetical protein
MFNLRVKNENLGWVYALTQHTPYLYSALQRDPVYAIQTQWLHHSRSALQPSNQLLHACPFFVPCGLLPPQVWPDFEDGQTAIDSSCC